MATRQEINDRLEKFTDKNCLNCYASIRDCGRIHLDDRFKINHLKQIMKILEDLED
tara:strand:+ start:18 stop:185 length:168 start_codon:yes stop_codon:yes gene_type:complete